MVKLFGRAFQIYDDVINLVEEKFGNMKNGLGEDITEGKISYPIVYCIALNKGKRHSVCTWNTNEEPKHASLHEMIDKDIPSNKKPVPISTEAKEEEIEEDLFKKINESNIYSNMQSKNGVEKSWDFSEIDKNLSQDLKKLVKILQEKTTDKGKISTAIQILKSTYTF